MDLSKDKAKKKKVKKKAASGKTPNLRHWLTQKLRRASYAWPPRKEAIKKGRVSRGKYKCTSCDGIFGPKEIQLDHTIPVIDPHTGFQNWDTYIARLFCEEENFSIKCRQCHSIKSAQENIVRRLVEQEKYEDNGDI